MFLPTVDMAHCGSFQRLKLLLLGDLLYEAERIKGGSRLVLRWYWLNRLTFEKDNVKILKHDQNPGAQLQS